MSPSEHPHALYRFRDQQDDLLYVGRSNDPIRRIDEHRVRKEWITSAVRIDLEWVPADMVRELERYAIESEHPRYNIQHNGGRVRVEVSAEVTVPSSDGLVVMVACGAAALLATKWGLDAAANWSVKRRATRAGMTIDLPSVRNPFTDDRPSWLRALLVASMTVGGPQSTLPGITRERATPSPSDP